MKRTFALIVALVVSWTTGVRRADASSIVLLSGDGSIANALNGTFGAPIDPGNQQFFLNILQGGTRALVQTTTEPVPDVVWGHAVNDFYNGAGISSSLITSPVTAADLVNVDLFVSMRPDSYSQAELDAMTSFLNGGGSVFFIGDNNGISGLENAVINNALAAVGSNLAIALDFAEGCLGGFHTLSGTDIANDPLTAGVSTFTCAAGSSVYSRNSHGFGSTVLFRESNGNPIVIYEPYGTPYTPVPEPTSLILLGTGAVLSAVRRRSSAQVRSPAPHSST